MHLQYSDQAKDSGVIAEKSLQVLIIMSHSTGKEDIKASALQWQLQLKQVKAKILLF